MANNYKGGIIPDGQGYIQILKPNHPNASKLGYVKEHRLIYEHYLSILFDEEVYIPKGYVVHHINEQKAENYIFNLTIMSKKEHQKHHHWLDKSKRKCSDCGVGHINKNYKTGITLWSKDGKGGFLCGRCRQRRRKKNKDLY